MRQHRRGKRGGCSCGVGPRWQKGTRNGFCHVRANAYFRHFYRPSYEAFQEKVDAFKEIWGPLLGAPLDIPVVMRDSETEGSEWPPAPAVPNEAKE